MDGNCSGILMGNKERSNSSNSCSKQSLKPIFVTSILNLTAKSNLEKVRSTSKLPAAYISTS